MEKKPRPALLSDLSLAELLTALRATEQSAGADSYSAQCIREAILAKDSPGRRRQGGAR
jgi:hypothetical protein